jgi:hypothetical protein
MTIINPGDVITQAREATETYEFPFATWGTDLGNISKLNVEVIYPKGVLTITADVTKGVTDSAHVTISGGYRGGRYELVHLGAFRPTPTAKKTGLRRYTALVRIT